MKKTIVTLLAFGAAMAQAAITEYDVKFTTNTAGTYNDVLSSGEANIWLGESSLSLDSWVMEFTMDSTTLTSGWSKNVFSTTNRSDGNCRPIGMMVWQGISAGITLQKSHYSTGVTNMETGVTSTSLSGYSKDSSFPLTMRLGYDAVTQNVYLYDVSNQIGIMGNLASQSNLRTSLVSGVDGQQSSSEKSIFFANAAGTPISQVTAWDVSDLAGNADAFKLFVMTLTPEPATSTLSLLALAGLAARRRRH